MKSINLELIKELAEKGFSDDEISIELKIKRSTIGRLRRINNINSGAFHRFNNIDNRIIKLHKEGKTFSEMSRILHMADSSIAYRAKNLNLIPNWTKRAYYTTSDRIKGYMIRNSKFSAKRRNIEFNLDYKDIFLPVSCPILNEPLHYKSNFEDSLYPTIDRIDNTKGYTKDNVWVISRLANSMKNCATLNQLETFCNNINILLKNQGALGNITDIFQQQEYTGN